MDEPVLGVGIANDGGARRVEVVDVGGTRARAIKEGLARLAETSILDRYS